MPPNNHTVLNREKSTDPAALTMTPPAGTVWSCSGAQSPWRFLPEDRLQAAPQRGPSAAEYYRSIKRAIVQGERNRESFCGQSPGIPVIIHRAIDCSADAAAGSIMFKGVPAVHRPPISTMICIVPGRKLLLRDQQDNIGCGRRIGFSGILWHSLRRGGHIFQFFHIILLGLWMSANRGKFGLVPRSVW